VHEIVTAHGGHIEVSSRLGEGTSIVVLLPLLPASRSAPRSATSMAPVRAARGTS
jgi:nitrogen-specific signal transduction histidine kinase